jgi:phosphatidylserine/phosphatidylglycerophosphate/cardiolipin synthase-like enzyme
VRLVVPGRPKNWAGLGALERCLDDLHAAGAAVWLYPAMMHAKVIVADDRVLVGSSNLDAWALRRNWELNRLFSDAGVAETFRNDLVEPDIAASLAAQPPSDTLRRVWNRLVAAVSPLL